MGDHDYHADVLLVHHAPVGGQGVGHGGLGGDVGPGLPEAVHEISVDVLVGPLLGQGGGARVPILEGTQSHPGMVIYKTHKLNAI